MKSTERIRKLIKQRDYASLSRFGVKAVPVLLETMEKMPLEDGCSTGPAIKHILKIGKQAAPGLIDGLKDYRSNVRLSSAFVVSNAILNSQRMRESLSPAVPLLIELAAKDLNLNTRLNSLEALSNAKDKRAVPMLVMALHNRESCIRGRAAEALGNIGDTTTIPSLMETLEYEGELAANGYHSITHVVAGALGKFGKDAKCAVLALTSLLKKKPQPHETNTQEWIRSAINSIQPGRKI